MGTSNGPTSGPVAPQQAPSLSTRLRGRAVRIGRWLRAHSTHTLVVAVLAALIPVLASTAIDRASNDAPPSCPGAGCDGKSPLKAGCSADLKNYEPIVENQARLQVRYSKHCGAVWGRILTGEAGDQVTLRVAGGSSQTALVEFGTDQFTSMASVHATFVVRVCVQPTDLPKRVAHWPGYCIRADDTDF